MRFVDGSISSEVGPSFYYLNLHDLAGIRMLETDYNPEGDL